MLTRFAESTRRASLFAGAILLSSAHWAAADDSSRVASIAAEGEPLVGVGLVIGLEGTGDSIVDPAAIDQTIVGVLKRAGLEPWRDQIGPGKVAVVMLSAELPVGTRDGATLDVAIQSIGDASSLAGGTLLVAPLRDSAGVVQAVGQGSLAVDDDNLADGAVVQRQRMDKATVASLQ